MDKDMLDSAKSGTNRKGKLDLIKHLSGSKIHKTAAIKAKCYECNGMGESNECDIIECPLHPYSPYKGKLPK